VTHTLGVEVASAASVPAADAPTVMVAETTAAAGYTTSAMLYRNAPHALRRFARHRWVDAPAQLVASALRTGLAARGVAVLMPAGGVRPEYRLASELVVLEQDFTVTPSRVVLAARLQLVDVHARRSVAMRTVHLARAAPSEDPAGGAASANALVAELVAAAHALWREALGQEPPPAAHTRAR
jgi:ABC-type uncharacterized transport system auxiliary subunit